MSADGGKPTAGFTLTEAILALALFAALSAAAISAVALGRRSGENRDAAMREAAFMQDLGECIDAYAAGDGETLDALLAFYLGQSVVSDNGRYGFDGDFQPLSPADPEAAYVLYVRFTEDTVPGSTETAGYGDWELTLYRRDGGGDTELVCTRLENRRSRSETENT